MILNTIHMSGYGVKVPYNDRGLWFEGIEAGKKAAIDCKLKECVEAGEVDIQIDDHISCVDKGFVKGFFGLAARAIGIPKFMDLVRINGRRMSAGYDSWGVSFSRYAVEYLDEEMIRISKKEKDDARKNKTAKWSEPVQLLVPEISTVMRLEEDWTFRLFIERRNWDFAEQFETLEGKLPEFFEITIKAGSELSVDRVYIRRGASDYSSITFRIRKGSKVAYKGKEVDPKTGRFWVKLSDVNRMKVTIDLGSLAEN
jgi:hypothetical protein